MHPSRVLERHLSVWLDLVAPLLVVGPDDVVRDANAPGADLLGRETGSLVGSSLPQLVPGITGTTGEGLATVLVQARRAAEDVAWDGSLADGRRLRLHLRPAGEDLLVLLRDVTDEGAVERQRDAALDAARADAVRTEHLLRLSEVLAATSTVDDVVRAVVRAAEESFGSSAAVTLVDRAAGVLRTPRLEHISAGSVTRWATVPLDEPGPGTEVVHSRRPLFLDRAELTRRWPALDARFRMVAATAVLPLTDAAGTVTGLLTLIWTRHHDCDGAERDLLRAFARYTAQALGHATVLAERTSEARLLQQAVQTRSLPVEPGLALAARYVPARTDRHVGGDWYDAVRLGPGRIMLVMGDVTGHDVAATAAMGQARTALRALAVTGAADPAGLLRGLDAVLGSLDSPLPATAVVLVLDLAVGRLCWSNAGHPPPLLVAPDGGVRRLEAAAELMLGVDSGTVRTTRTEPLVAGSVLVLYTDGLIEDRVNDLDTGIDRLAQTAPLLLDAPVDALTPALDELVVRVGAGGGDDVAVLVARLDRWADPGPVLS
ncbi:SpoIIE family protein phosphatase [Kineococcus gynurae]|uniref:SpoIIE family protein phosphatase n=1 Tax=Kineococcus gynurae TaxID=452979 RepID=A0ABV5LU94_9ACTN